MKEIIIRIWQDKFWFNHSYSLPQKCTTFYMRHMKFLEKEIFWKLSMVCFDKEKGALTVEVVDYYVSDTSTFSTQNPKVLVNHLWFINLNWEQFSPFLQNPDLNEYRNYLNLNYHSISFGLDKHKLQELPGNKPERLKLTKPEHSKFIKEISMPQNNPLPFIQYINDTFRITFNEAYFRLGYVGFDKYITELKKEVAFKIINENILPEFDLIKFWFAKKLKAKDFKVSVEIVIREGEIYNTSAKAPVIDKINNDLIEAVRIQRTYALKQPLRSYKPDKSLFTSEDIFDEIDSDDREGNVFNQSETEILKYFIEKTNIRNKKQLGYLAGKKQSENQKLLFTLNPNFGFLFFIEGDKNNHFVWELLNSHATYVWSISKGDMTKELQLKRIQESINTVRNFGRTGYKNEYRNNHLDQDLVFNVINHDKADSDFIDGFVLWKERVNELLE